MSKPKQNCRTIRDGVVTLYLNGEARSSPLGDTSRLMELSRMCDAVGEAGLARQLEEDVEYVNRPLDPAELNPLTDPGWQEMKRLMEQLRRREISRQDCDSALELRRHRMNRKRERYAKRLL